MKVVLGAATWSQWDAGRRGFQGREGPPQGHLTVDWGWRKQTIEFLLAQSFKELWLPGHLEDAWNSA